MFDNSFNFGDPGQEEYNTTDMIINEINPDNNSNIGLVHDMEFGFGAEDSFTKPPIFGNINKDSMDEEYTSKTKLGKFFVKLQTVFDNQQKKNQEIYLDNESELVLKNYCQTSTKIENSQLIISSIIELKNFQNQKKSFNQVKTNTMTNSANMKSLYMDEIDNEVFDTKKSNTLSRVDSSEYLCYKIIEEKLLLINSIFEAKLQNKYEIAFYLILNRGQNKMYEEKLIKIKEANVNEEYRLSEKKRKIQELEDKSVKQEKQLKRAGDERDELLTEVKREEKVFGNIKVKDRSLEMILLEKELTKYERENRELKLKLEKKEKEVRRFMSEMNKIQLHYDESDGKRRFKIDKIPINDIQMVDDDYFKMCSDR